jgi:hypothetical protein
VAKPGRTPSLIGSGAGVSKFVTAKRERTCRRCGEAREVGEDCVEVGVPGSMGHRTYCLDCYGDILGETGKQLQKLRAELQRRL